MRNYIFKVKSFLLISFFCVSCAKEEELLSIPDSGEEDTALKSQLITLNGSLDFYILPDSREYSKIPSDPKNPITKEKVTLGQLLFHETGIGAKPEKEEGKATYSCASCHHSAAGFQSGIKQGIGEGGSGFGLFGEMRKIAAGYTPETIDIQPIKTPTALNSAYQKVMLWNGQFGATGANIGTEANWTEGTPKETNSLGFEGVEIQAIAGLKVHRMEISKAFCDSNNYTALFDKAFPDSPEEERYSLINTGLAIAAYERTLLATNSNFQEWLKGTNEAMSTDEKKGALLFFGKAKCYECHTGPALNTNEFYALGMNDLEGPKVHGTVDEATKKGRGGFTGNSEDDFKFKVPQLYNLKDVRFYGHGGSFTSIREVINYKNNAVKENREVSSSSLSDKFSPLLLTNEEVTLLTLFVEKSLYDGTLNRYAPNRLPTGLCFPNADTQSMQDMGCNN